MAEIPDLRAIEIADRLVATDPNFQITRKTIRGVELSVFANGPQTLREFFGLGEQYRQSDFVVYKDERFSLTAVMVFIQSKFTMAVQTLVLAALVVVAALI